MWRNPRYDELIGRQNQPQAATAEAPQPTGEILARFPRTGRDKGEEELRISLDTFNGNDFLQARLWTQDGRTGAWWPSKRGVSIRLAEANGVADALMAGLGIADRRRAQAMPRGDRRRDAKAVGSNADAPQHDEPAGADFDEFNNEG